MNNDFGLPDYTITAIQGVLAQFPQVGKAIIYGSRVRDTYKNGSDIDLALVAAHDVQPLNLTLQFQIDEALEELLLPYQVDLSILADIDNPRLVDHIERVGVVFYSV